MNKVGFWKEEARKMELYVERTWRPGRLDSPGAWSVHLLGRYQHIDDRVRQVCRRSNLKWDILSFSSSIYRDIPTLMITFYSVHLQNTLFLPSFVDLDGDGGGAV